MQTFVIKTLISLKKEIFLNSDTIKKVRSFEDKCFLSFKYDYELSLKDQFEQKINFISTK